MDIKVLADNNRNESNTGLKHFYPLVHYECKSKHLKGNAYKRPPGAFSFLPVVCCLLVADWEIWVFPINPFTSVRAGAL